MMRSWFCSASLGLLLIVLPSLAWALMPPFTPKELKERSNHIVRGEITQVMCTGEFEETHCAYLTGYKATLKVRRTLKGKRYKTLNLYFKEYDFKEGCVGSADTVHYSGEEALYYLSCKGDSCYLTHWNGIEYKRRGNGPLPECKRAIPKPQ